MRGHRDALREHRGQPGEPITSSLPCDDHVITDLAHYQVKLSHRDTAPEWVQMHANRVFILGWTLSIVMNTARALPGRLSALSVSHSKSLFLWRFGVAAQGV